MAWLALIRWYAGALPEATQSPNMPTTARKLANYKGSGQVDVGGGYAVDSNRRTKGVWPWVLFSLILACSLLVLPDAAAVPSFFQMTRYVQQSFRSETLWQAVAFCGRISEQNIPESEQFTDNRRTNEVQWDSYSLIVKGQRVFLHSGEFHTFRLPVPSLWPDILQKIKAAGMNAISVYTHMGLINPSRGVLDFHGFRALHPMFDAAKESGLWIVLRPGPYINAETSAGGLAHWVTSEVAGALRTNASDYKEAWVEYIRGIIKMTAPYQITEGGPVIAIQIDNEWSQTEFGRAEYFEQLEDVYYNSSIVVPLTYNDAYQGKNFVNGTGAVDIYGLDAYPLGFDCSHPDQWFGVTENYNDYHADTNPKQPFYVPEFQGGSFDAWGPAAPGYSACRKLTGTEFQSVYNLQLWASNAKMINYYMLYGGTSWGAIPFPGVYTSYDYGAAISESRELTGKYAELKRQGLFLRSSPEFYETDWIGNSSAGVVTTSNPAAFVTLLRNPDSKASFYILRQKDSTSTSTINLKMNVSTSISTLQIPQVVSFLTLNGRQSKVIVTDYAFGTSRLLYSTAQIFFAGKIGNRDVLFLFGDSNQEHEASLSLKGTPRPQIQSANIAFTQSGVDHTIISFLAGIQGLITIWDSDEQLVLFSDTSTAGTFWSPVIATDPGSTFGNYWQVGTNASILVGGPYLVRGASINGSELRLRGDLKDDVRLTVIAPGSIRSITWNGISVAPDVSAGPEITFCGRFTGQLRTKQQVTIPVPTLGSWKFADSLPEINKDFSDKNWTVANHTSTNIPFKPYYTSGKVLYGCDYQFCENIVLWRGHFNATGDEKFVNLSINGGAAFAASVWLNDVFLKTTYGNSTNNRNVVRETDEKYSFPAGSVLPSQDNVITVVQDNMGLEEIGPPNAAKSPRGIRGFKLDSGDFVEWKVQGKVGGYINYPDKVRGVLNEGGLFGERQGWHLPGFNTSLWIDRDISLGLPNMSAGIGFFVSTFDLNIPIDMDVPMSFTFDHISQPYRAYLFVNGWMMGKRIANLGPQFKFPVHQGILDYSGTNTVAVALWALEDGVNIAPSVKLTVDGLYEGFIDGVQVDNPPWSPAPRT